ncbi:hypothetical protein NRB16_28315 [Pseudomonas sp. LJDD11]|uniref:hypothetical protein n=1 Tax=Pseudomonas sp. LJDD11 TaxID=2931984 RepID=UPI00211D031E|nr:hypothetical protein [Pseudomonas sp. LJDD11]MCQ9427423.1 hypothetical protein [Pseudomonas sp. LJDD11]
MTPLEIIKAFVESLMTPDEFENQLRDNPALSAVLQEGFSLPNYVEEPDLYTFAIGQDYSNVESIFNTQVLLSSFLQSRAVEHERSTRYEDLFNLLLKVQPKWLSLSSGYLSSLLEMAPSQKPKELQAWLKDKIKDEFRYLKTSPKWLQAPAWPIENGKPLVFVGQLDVSDLSHDTSQAYVFFNAAANTFHTFKQSC